MIIKLLDLLKEGKCYSVQDIADILNIDTLAIKAQIEYLERNKYIKRIIVKNTCQKGCNGCMGCSKDVFFPVMWELN